MRGVSTDPKVLLCTAYRRSPRDYQDIVKKTISIHRFPRSQVPFRINTSLRFIKQNVPEVEILEYPLWHEYVTKLKEGWDVVGFTCFQHQIFEVRRMIQEARRRGVHMIWAGGYGALDYELPSLVDRVFIGPAEDQIAQVFGYRVQDDEIEHPVMMSHFSIVNGLRLLTFGMLYTTHGCPFRCAFCQSPIFEKRRFTVNLESIERVLTYYHEVGVNKIVIFDEFFGYDPVFSDKLTRLLARFKFHWLAESRIKSTLANLDAWFERGLRFTAVGVESMNQCSLDEVNKKQTVEEIVTYARKTQEKPGLHRTAAYMIGFENMTVEDTVQDALRLKNMGFDAYTVSILTPYPRTPLWDSLSSKYGIFDRNYRHYYARHLVWNHPYISPMQMHYLLKFLKGMFGRPFDVYRHGLKRIIWEELKKEGGEFLWRHLIKGPIASLFINDRKQFFFPKLPHRTPLQSQRRRKPVTAQQDTSIRAGEL